MTNEGSDTNESAGADQAPLLMFIFLSYYEGRVPDIEIVVANASLSDGNAEIIADYARNPPSSLVATLNATNLGVNQIRLAQTST